MAHVAHVDREFLGVGRDLHVLLRQHEGALLAVEREHRHAVAHGQHQRGLRAVDAVAGGHLLAAGLQEVGFLHAVRGRRASCSTLKMVPMLTLTSMLLRAVERIEQQQVFALRIAVGHDVDAVHLLADAMAARWPPHSLASISTSLAMMSSFFWISPCTFSLLGRAEHAAERALVDGHG